MPASVSGSGRLPVERIAPMRRSPGGRHCVVKVLLTETELASLRGLSGLAGVSVQRYLIESAMSGSAANAASRRRAAVDARAARMILKGVANNLNQLTKWANANHALPDSLERLVDDLARAVADVEETTSGLGTVFREEHQSRRGAGRSAPS